MLRIPIGKCRSGSAPKLQMELQSPIWSFGAPNPPRWSSGSSIWEDLQEKVRNPIGKCNGLSTNYNEFRKILKDLQDFI